MNLVPIHARKNQRIAEKLIRNLQYLSTTDHILMVM